MIIIVKPLSLIEAILPKQDFNKNIGKYRWFRYLVRCEIEDGELIFNDLTKAFIKVDKNELGLDNPNQVLLDNYFIVPEDFDDSGFVNQINALYNISVPSENGIWKYVISTTSDCNARCYYCFEKGFEKESMTEATAIQSANYILEHSKNHEVRIQWFGGEPLYNIKVIDIISDILSKRGKKYSSFIVTNGYLFNEEVINRAKELWHLSRVQITLDGTREKYNRIKAYINKDKNAFDRVLSNIKMLLEAQISVDIRLNLSYSNFDDLKVLIVQLHEFFGVNDNLRVYCHSLYEDNLGGARNDSERRLVLDKVLEYNNWLFDLGLRSLKSFNPKYRVYHCMADNPNSIMILPNGDLGKCEHYGKEEKVGSIYSKSLDQKQLKKFKERQPRMDECIKCSFYPSCIKLKVCENEKRCDEYDRAFGIKRVRRNLLDAYALFLDNKLKVENNDEVEIQC